MRIQGASKYHARKTTVDGITFDSKKESQRYAELKLLEKAGEIRGLELQPVFELRARSDYISTNTVKLGVYKADFRYEQKLEVNTGNVMLTSWHKVIEDVKGVKTPLYSWKKKHVEAQYGITVREIR